MTTVADVARVLESTPEKYNRTLYFAALLARASGSEVVVVGGSAIEIYTRGGYVSGDIDIRADRGAIHRTLRRWGFEDHGRLWIRKDWQIAIDVVGDQYSGDTYRATSVLTPHGPVRLAVVEDLFVKRLASAKHWRVRVALDEADLLWRDYRRDMDEAYLDRQARAYDVTDLLAEFRRQSLSGRSGPRSDHRRRKDRGVPPT